MPEGAKTIFTIILVAGGIALFFYVKKHDFKPQLQALQQGVNNTLDKMKPVDPDKAEYYRQKKPLPSGAIAAAGSAVAAAAPEQGSEVAAAAAALGASQAA